MVSLSSIVNSTFFVQRYVKSFDAYWLPCHLCSLLQKMMSSLPASTLDKSSMSLIKVSKSFPDE